MAICNNNSATQGNDHIWPLASILEDLAASTRKHDPEAFSKVATATDGCPGQLLRGIRSVCWMAYNFP